MQKYLFFNFLSTIQGSEFYQDFVTLSQFTLDKSR